jgi:protein SCO1
MPFRDDGRALSQRGRAGERRTRKRALVPSIEMRKPGLDPRLLLSLLALVLVAGVIALLAVGGSSASRSSGANGSGAGHFHAVGVLSPTRQAPPLVLRNYLGQPVNIDSYRGKAVLVTFLYTNCPDICPLITSNLRVAQNLMGTAVSSKAQIIAVSVDPRGDTPKAVAAFLARHEMTGRMQYLIGSAAELGAVWKAWGVGSEQDAQQPQFVNHSGLIYGITASGKQETVYAADFRPADIAHDVPLLAAR